MTHPKVSVVMPTYNGHSHIGEAIESVRAQTYPDWELLVIDDHSTDDTPTLVQVQQKRDSRIFLLGNSRSKGPAGSRNTGIERATGRFIAFLDSDDAWHPEKLSRQVSFMLSEKVIFTYSSYRWMTDKGQMTRKVVRAPPVLTYADLLRYNHVGCLTVVYDASVVGKVLMPEPPDGARRLGHEDYATWLSIVKIAEQTDDTPKVRGLVEELAYYRINPKGVSYNKLRAGFFAWDVYRRHLQFGLGASLCLTARYGLYGIKRRLSS